jgi:predicted RNA-binding protein YlxR (DUF448 family)
MSKKTSKTLKRKTANQFRKNKTQKIKKLSKSQTIPKTAFTYYYRNKVVKQSSAQISDGYVYFSYPTGRSYWLLNKMKKIGDKMPKITFNDKTKTIRISSNHKLVFKGDKYYELAKKYLF